VFWKINQTFTDNALYWYYRYHKTYPFQYVSRLFCELFMRETTVVTMDTTTTSMKKPTWKRPWLAVKEQVPG